MLAYCGFTGFTGFTFFLLGLTWKVKKIRPGKNGFRAGGKTVHRGLQWLQRNFSRHVRIPNSMEISYCSHLTRATRRCHTPPPPPLPLSHAAAPCCHQISGQVGLVWFGSVRFGSVRVGSGWVRSGWFRLGWVGLGQVR